MTTRITISDEVQAQFGLNRLPEAERDAVVSIIGEVIYQSVMRKALDALGRRKQEEFLTLLEARNAEPGNAKAREQVETFFAENFADFGQLVEQECRAFYASFKSIYREIRSPR